MKLNLDGQSGRILIESLRQKLKPRSVLIAGPYVGEFGHELMDWQGYIRERRPHYEQVHVITYPGRKILYENCIVHEHQIRLESAGYHYGNMSLKTMLQHARRNAEEQGIEDYDIFNTFMLSNRFLRKLLWKQVFVEVHAPTSAFDRFDIAFHFRHIDKLGPDKFKNYPPQMADNLTQLCVDAGYKCCSIGHPLYSYCPPACEDFRSENLDSSVLGIDSSRLVVGENSGPMHLANLCGKPTLIWAQDQWRIDYSLRWNIFHVPIFVATNNTFKPDPFVLKVKIDQALNDLLRPQ